MIFYGLGLPPQGLVANNALINNPVVVPGSSTPPSVTTIDCTNPANANNQVCVSLGAFPTTVTQSGQITIDCTNPANATNPACVAPAWDGTILGIPWWVWLGASAGIYFLVKRKKQKPATSTAT